MYSHDTFEHRGLTFCATIEHDDGMGHPWDEHDGHGPVREIRACSYSGRPVKRPGERILMFDRSYGWAYDWQAAMQQARAEGWGLADEAMADLEKKLGHAPTPGEVIHAAVERDFDHLRRYATDQWHWVGVVVTLLDMDDEPTDQRASLWGMESDCDDYLESVRIELADQIADEVGDDTINLVNVTPIRPQMEARP